LRAVVQIAGLGALQPDHFATLFCHCELQKLLVASCKLLVKDDTPSTTNKPLATSNHQLATAQARIFVTTPDPTVLPPSRTAKRSFSSIAIGAPRSISMVTLSPGMTISAPPSSLALPVTSVVRK